MIPTTVPKIYTKTEPGRTLMYEGKHANEYWLADTPKRVLAAFLAMFNLLEEMEYYYMDDDSNDTELKEVTAEYEALKDIKVGDIPDKVKILQTRMQRLSREISRAQEQKELYKAAKKGNAIAAAHLVMQRSDCEYEEYRFVTVEDPLKKNVSA